MKKNLLLPAALCLLVISCEQKPKPPAQDYSRYLDQFIDTAANPGHDFFDYAVGKWTTDNPIPASERGWGIYNVVQEETYDRLLKINRETSESNAAAGTNAQKIGDFWYAGMDTIAIEKAGITPLKEELEKIAAVSDLQSLLEAIGHLTYINVGPLYSSYIFQDEMNSEKVSLHLYQGGVGLPDRDYYFDDDARTRKIRDEYVLHVANMFKLLGDDETTAAANAATVMRIETDLAKASRKLAELRDPYANYHKMAVEEMKNLTPSVDWKFLLEKSNIKNLDTLIVGQPEFFRQVESSLKKESLDHWKTYLRWHLINTYAGELSAAFDKEHFRFYGTVLNGTQEQRPRWKRVLDNEENYLGDALGQLYVEKYFSPATKARYEKLTEEIFSAFATRIQQLDWMSDSTKAAAVKKLNAVTKKIGYPEQWKDYSTYEVSRTSYLANVINGNKWLSDDYIAKLYKPVDRTEWGMTPQTYNAYYNPSNNEIVMPAAIFILPGIPDSLADDALVYAYAGGSTIGHEITHGFDDQGSQFDEKGNLKEWWIQQDRDHFEQRCEAIIKQYNEYIVLDSLRINGDATQGENIADLGGILLGWDAFKKTGQYRNNEIIGGYTPAQRFFIGWALAWMSHIRPENLAVRVKTDVHAPSFLRVNGPIVNMPEFYEAFGIQPGDAMYRADSLRVRIW
jgi:putative endopeptidase